MTISLTKLAKECHEIAKSKGFWDNPRSIDHCRGLAISELGEAINADRIHGRASIPDFLTNIQDGCGFKYSFELEIKNTFEDELADFLIRVLDYTYHFKIPIKNLDVLDYKIKYSSFPEIVAYLSYFLNTSPDVALNIFLKYCEENNIDILWLVKQKMKYNKTRVRLHGKKY